MTAPDFDSLRPNTNDSKGEDMNVHHNDERCLQIECGGTLLTLGVDADHGISGVLNVALPGGKMQVIKFRPQEAPGIFPMDVRAEVENFPTSN